MGYRGYSTAVGHIVDPNGFGDFTTIQAAINAASSGQTIFLRPGTYNESPNLKAGVDLVAFITDSEVPNVIINGTCSFSSAGTIGISGVMLQTNGNFALSVTGSAASIVYLNDCYINCLNATGIQLTSSSGSSQINVTDCFGNLSTTGIGIFSNSSAGSLIFRYSSFFNTGSSTTASNTSSGGTTFSFCGVSSPLSTSASGAVSFLYTNVNTSNTTCLTTAGTGTCHAECSDFISGTASAISIGSGTTLQMDNICRVESSNTNAITGTGTLKAGLINYTGTSSTINTSTVTPFSYFPSRVQSFTPTLTGGTTAGTTTYTIQVGQYIQLAPNLVFLTGTVQYTAATGTGNLILGGLPFTIKNTANLVFTAGIRLDAALPANSVNTVMQGIGGTTTCNFVSDTVAGVPSNVQISNALVDLYFSFFYFI